jgi:benzoate membrane transport protein
VTANDTPVPDATNPGPAQAVIAGFITATVGFSSSFAVVLTGLHAVGADPGQAASGLFVLCLTMGVAAIALSLRYRLPISIAWSTPGAALLASSGHLDHGFHSAITAFLLCGALLVLTGVLTPLRRLVNAIPAPIANALLAGALLELCVAPVHAVVHDAAAALPVVIVWAVLTRVNRRWAVPGAMGTALIAIALSHHPALQTNALAPHLVVTGSHLDLQAITLGFALYIVTMASQNIPGVAVLSTFGYRAPLRAALVTTGGGTLLGAAFGGHAINLAAISAALCAGPDAHPDKSRRWIASSTAGAVYVMFGCAAGVVTAIAAIAPTGLIEAVAGLALLPTLGAALASALEDLEYRDAAVATFAVMVSGISVAGIGSACWALLAGIVIAQINRVRRVYRS